MALTVEITKPNGSVFKTGLTQSKVNLSVLPGDTVRLVDTTTGKTPSNIMVKKIGDGLLVDGLPNGQLVEIKDFYTSCSPTNACALKIDGLAGSADTIITQVSQPISLLPDNQALMYGADSSQGAAALAADGGAAGGAAAAGGVSSGAWLAGLAGLGLAAAAGGGGGGGSSPAAAAPAPTPSPGPAPAPADTTPPSAPVAKVDVASDSGTSSTDGLTKIATPTISGTAEAGATVTVSYTDASDVVQTLTTTAASDGSWHVDLASALKEGANTVTVTATDAAGNVSSATSVVVTLDTIAPTGLVAHLDTATDSGASHSDGITNNIHPTLSGTGTAGDMITVSYTDSGAAAATATAVVDRNGNWTVSPTSVSQNATTAFSVTETDAAGNVSTPVAVNVTVDTTAPAAPVAHLDASTDTGVAGDGRTTSLQPVISGTGAAGDQIAVTFTDAASQSHTLAATVAGNGTWSVAAANNILTNADTVFSATETDTAGNVSAATSVTVHQDTAATSTGGADVIVGGAGQHVLAGGGGDDVLVAGLAGETRNSQFEYWNIGNASGVFQTGPDYAALTNPSNIGWTIQGTTPAVTHNFGANGTHATDGNSFGRKTLIRIVRSQSQPIFRPRGKHAVWLRHAA